MLPSGITQDFEWYKARDFCVIVPLKGSRLVMIENYRYPADSWFLEFPAGHVEDGERIEDCAQRELLEETGYTSTKLRHIGSYYVSSRTLQKGHVFSCIAGTKLRTSREPSELQRVTLVTPQALRSQVASGKVVHAATIIAHSFAELKRLI
jgi:ADP-ribose pyrophosphatase